MRHVLLDLSDTHISDSSARHEEMAEVVQYMRLLLRYPEDDGKVWWRDCD